VQGHRKTEGGAVRRRHRIQFPPGNLDDLAQDETFFYILDGDKRCHFRLHDYDKIFRIPGLYEQVVYERLKCQSHFKVSEVLKYAISQSQERFTELRVLDLGAGNGMVGEELKKHGVSRLVGVDIIKEACEATERDRPGVYDAYYVVDFCNLSEEERDEISSWSFNCLTTVAALGFGDIPPKAFMEAFNLVNDNGWIAFNIKETFLDRSDETGFSKLIRELIFSKHLELYHLERYRHRLSVEGEPLFYFALGGRKNSDVTRHFLKSVGVST
jgi:SAM-dependent methyltransferase